MTVGGAGSRRALVIAGVWTLAAAAAGGCTVGSGSGSARGPLWVLGCSSELPDGNLGTPDAPYNFSLDPIFFAGEPIEDVSMTVHENRLGIRMQRNAGPIEYNDTLAFDIQDSLQVARCVRGATVNGVGDWDMNDAETSGAWCDWSGAGSDGGAGGATRARIQLTPGGYVQASLALLKTCPLEEGASLVGHSKGGWIEFVDFGGAAQPDLPSDQRTQFDATADFKVNFGERLRATFHVDLEDDRVIIAPRMGLPPPSPRIGGTLDGRFDFDLMRGRAAQPFP
jgi:hypothetical protein